MNLPNHALLCAVNKQALNFMFLHCPRVDIFFKGEYIFTIKVFSCLFIQNRRKYIALSFAVW